MKITDVKTYVLNTTSVFVRIYTDEGIALDRLTLMGMSREDAVRRLMCQMPITQKISRSDFIIDNSGSPEEIRPKIRQIHRVLLAEALG